MKKVDIISTVVQRDRTGGKIPSGNTIFIQGGSLDLDEAKAELMLELAKEFIHKAKDDTASGVINFLAGIKIANILIDGIMTLESSGEATDTNVMSAARVVKEIEDSIKELDDRFLSKTKDDSTPFNLGVGKNLSVGGTLNVGSNAVISGQTISKDKITAEKGIQIGESFVPGIITGSGGFIDEKANAELESLIIRRFLEVPELRYNRVQVTLGDKWNAAGAGVIERVSPDSDTTGTAWLKLEEGEFGAIAVGDICMGIFHSMNNADNALKDEEVYVKNDKGEIVLAGFQFSGFYTCYFKITEITGSDNKEFRYELRQEKGKWEHKFHPSSSMHFVCYGSFSNPSRQTSVYTTRTYTRLLKNQNTWEIGSVNIAMQYGDLSNMSLHGLDMRGYSAYLNNIYMTGTIAQIKADGTPVLVANDRGDWKGGTPYAYYDRVSHNGSLWLCVNKDGTNTEPKDGDSSWLCQVKAGSSITSAGHWESKNTPYPANSIVTFADKVWISNKETSNPPFGTYTDKDGNRLTYNDGGYILVETLIQSEDWDLLLDAPQLTDGKDGESLQVRYSSDKSNWHVTFVEGDVWMQQRVGEGSVWSDAIRIVGESGSAGADGTYYDYQFAVNDSLDVAPTTGWQDTPPSVGIGQYLWMRTRLVNPNTSEENPWSVVRIGGEKGEQGDSVSNMGAWKTGMAVPYLGIVTMGGKTFMSKVATTNPPMWTWTDKDGNRLIFSDGGYILTGELNTDEYDLVMQDGKDGKDGRDGKGYEYIYIHTKEDNRPSTPKSEQVDDYIPSGWHDDPIGVTSSLPYEWASLRTKRDGVWSAYSTPALWAKYSIDAILADLDNEMDNVALGSDGKTISDTTISITAAMYYGSTKQSLASIEVGSVQGITSSYVLNTGVVTLKVSKGVVLNERTEIPITVTASINGKTESRTLKFTLAAVKGGADAVLYDIVTSVSAIGKRKDGSYTVAGVSATRMKTIGEKSSETTDGVLMYSIDGGTEQAINNNVLIAAERIGSKVQFIFYNSEGVVVDKESVPMVIDGSDGKDGEGFTLLGNWKTGLVVPKMGVVTMGGESFAAKVATNNPPMWTWTDKDGNRFIFPDGGYILTGELNTSEYDRWTVKGENGKDGQDGKDGESSFKSTVFIRQALTPATPTGGSYDSPIPTSSPKWEDGIPSGELTLWASTCTFKKGDENEPKWSEPSKMTDTASFEVVYHSSETMPQAPTNYPKTTGSWIPNNGWTDDPTTSSVWMATAVKSNGLWGEWKVSKIKGEKGNKGDKGDKGDEGLQGQQGIQGCIIRKSEFRAGVEYRNDEKETSGTRYVDVVLIRNSSMATGWIAYKCKKTTTLIVPTAPTSSPAWSDGIPDGGTTLWMSTCVFTQGGTSTPIWSEPIKVTDTSSVELVFHSSETTPSAPTNYPSTTGTWTPNNGWTDEPKVDSVWMAKSVKTSGVWSAWQITKIKGEGSGSTFTSTVFIRQNRTPSIPTGGSYDNPLPTSSPWLPENGWELTPISNTLWKAVSKRINGTWSAWAVSEYKAGYDVQSSADVKVVYRSPDVFEPGYAGNTQYWEEFGLNTTSIFTDLIVAKDASIDFVQGNQLLIKKNDGKVTAGLSGSDAGDKVRFWAGGDIPDSAPFRVDETGNIIAEKGTFGGYLKTTLVDIDNSDATPVPSKYDSENFSAYRLNKNVYVDATFCEVVLPCSEDYSGVRVIIMDTYYAKSRVSTKPTLIRTEDDSKIACGLLKTDASTGKYLVNAIQIDCGTVELIYKSYENENGIKENGWIVISQSCGTFEEFNGIGYN